MKIKHPERAKIIEQIEEDLYVVDIISGSCSIGEVLKLKAAAIEVFQ